MALVAKRRPNYTKPIISRELQQQKVMLPEVWHYTKPIISRELQPQKARRSICQSLYQTNNQQGTTTLKVKVVSPP